MAIHFDKYRLKNGDDIGDPRTLNDRFRDVDLRLHTQEEIEKEWTFALEELRRIGLDRINEVLRPAYEEIAELGQLGAIFSAHSATELIISEGLKVLTIDEADRDRFAPAAYVALFQEDDLGRAMLGRVVDYDRAGGLLAVDVDRSEGGGSAAGWMVSAASATDNAAAARDADQHRAEASSAADAAVAARDVAVEKAGEADDHRASAFASAGLAASSAASALAERQAAAAERAATEAASSEVETLRDEVVVERDAVAQDRLDTIAARDAALAHEAGAAASADAATSAEAAAAGIQAATGSVRDETIVLRDEAAGHEAGAQAAQSAAEMARDGSILAQAASEAARDATIGATSTINLLYLGAASIDPLVDLAGDPLGPSHAGAEYWNTTFGEKRIWTGTGWTVAYVPVGSEVATVFGRSGSVTAEAGDYSANQISNLPISGLAGSDVQAVLGSVKTALDTKLGVGAKAADSDKLDGLDSTAFVKNGDILHSNLPFTPIGKRVYLSGFTDRFLRREAQIEVKVDGVVQPFAAMFNGDYDSGNLVAQPGDSTKTIGINFAAKGLTGPSGFVYAEGFFIVQFYPYEHGVITSARTRDKDGVWVDRPVTQASTFNGDPFAYRIDMSGGYPNYITDVEFTLEAQPEGGAATRITSFEYHGRRMGLEQSAMMTVGGGSFYGTVSGKSAGAETWSIAQDGTANFEAISVDGQPVAVAGHNHALADLSDVEIAGAPAGSPLVTLADGTIGYDASIYPPDELLLGENVWSGASNTFSTLNASALQVGQGSQDGFSVRWRVATSSDDDFVLKNSPDGAAYSSSPALTVKNKSGRAIFKKVQNGLRPWNVVLRDYVAGSPFLLSSSAVDNAWRCICWSPELGIFAAVATTGTGNRVMTSPDGINWTSGASAADNQWTSVCWSPELGLFAAVANTGTGNRVMTSPDGINWTPRASAADNQWFSVCWSPELGLFAAVADSGTGNRVMTSPDGINWTVRASAADNAWRSVCWSPELGLFAAVSIGGAGNRVMTSPDGVNWTIRASAADNAWISVCWSPELGLFAATAITGAGNRVMTSPDGINWTARASAADNEWYFVCWSPELGLFAAVSITGTGNRVMTSPDGINWTARTSAADYPWISICWSPELGLFAAVAYSGGASNRVMTSKSAYSYEYPGRPLLTAGTGLLGGSDPSQDRTFSVDFASQAESEAGTDNTKPMTPLTTAQAIAAQTSGIFATADHNHALADLSDVDIDGAPAGSPLVTLADGTIGYDASIYPPEELLDRENVWSGASNTFGALNASALQVGQASPGGFSARWQFSTSGNDDLVLNRSVDGVTFPYPPAMTMKNKSGRAVFKKVQNGVRPWNVVLRNHVIGSPWLSSSTNATSWYAVCWSPEFGLFVAVAYSNSTGFRAMTSPDGINWTIRASAADNNWTSVCWSPELGLFAAVAQSGTGNRVMTSPDGINWTVRASAADNQWFSICWSPELGLFAAVASSGTGDRVMTSPDGINWTVRASAADNQWRSVCWSPELGLFAAVASSGTGNRVMTSPDGINWTIRASAADNSWFSICWSPELGLFAAVAYSGGASNRVMTSPDGINWTARASAADNQWTSVCWSPELGLFAAVAESGTGNRVMTSPDGIDWTIRASAADNQWRSVCWSPELGLFAAVAYSGGASDRVMTSKSAYSYEYPGRPLLTAGTGLLGSSDPSQDRTFSVDFASQAEAEAGTDNSKSMTPLTTAQAIAAQTSGIFATADHNHAFADLSDVEIDGAPAGSLLVTQANGTIGYGDALVVATSSPGDVLRLERTDTADYFKVDFAGGVTSLDGTSPIRWKSGGATFLEYSAFGPYLALSTAGLERMRVDKNGNVGIGTNSPQDILDVVGARWYVGSSRDDATDKYWRPALYNYYNGDGSWVPFFAASSEIENDLRIGGGTSLGNAATRLFFHTAPDTTTTAGVVRMMIDGDGNVGVGNSTPTEKLHVTGNILATGDITAFSDERLKSDVCKIDGALDKVRQIEGVTFTKDGKKGIGVIAQKIAPILPEVVQQSGEYMSVAYGNIIAVVIEALKEEDKLVSELMARIDQLEKKLANQ